MTASWVRVLWTVQYKQQRLCLCSPKKWSTYTHRHFNETIRFQFHFAFQRWRFMRLLVAIVVGSHTHKKCKRKTFTVNAQSKHSVSYVWISGRFAFLAVFFFFLTSAYCTVHGTWTMQIGKWTVFLMWTVIQKLFFYCFQFLVK